MTKSRLIQDIVPAHTNNYTKGRQAKIRCITVHHMAGKLDAYNCGKIFQNPNRRGSSHYGIGYEGEIINYVDEDDTAWTNSNWPSNCESITIECANSQNGGDWPISTATFEALVSLVKDIKQRYKLSNLVVGENLTYHSMFTATNCPGSYLKNKLGELVDRVNGEVKNQVTEVPISQIAERVIKGEFGNAPERYTRLKAAGYDPNEVQKLVNQMCNKISVPSSDRITEGDKVILKINRDINGVWLRKNRNYYIVTQIVGKRVVLSYEGGGIYCAADLDNVVKY